MALYLVALLFGTLVAETILASVHVRAHRQAGHMDASDLIKTLQNTLRGGGRSLIAPLLSIAFLLVRESLDETGQSGTARAEVQSAIAPLG